MSSAPRLTRRQARRILVRAQGFGRARPAGGVNRTHLTRTVGRLGFFQIDSVSVLQRAHLMPLYSRLGPYDEAVFFRAAERAPRVMFEYWTHMAAYTDVNLWPALRHRMTSKEGMWDSIRSVARDQPDLVHATRDVIAEFGPLTSREVESRLDVASRIDRVHWGWNRSATKLALEHLFHVGDITSARRTAAFERVYDLPERVVPARVLAQPDLDEVEAHRVLVEHAARALGIATEPCLRDYFRTEVAPTRRAVSDLVAAGVLEPVSVEGWDRPAYLHAEAPTARPLAARALLSPFDPLVFDRARTSRAFGFDYRIEIYVPAAQRVFGYYVLPFLLGDELVARVDLKADRAAGRLVVLGAFGEPDAPAATAAELAAALVDLAGWLGLGGVEVCDRGDLAAQIRVQPGV